MITWPRVRITFALIGMFATAIFLWDQLTVFIAWAYSLLVQGKEMLP